MASASFRRSVSPAASHAAPDAAVPEAALRTAACAPFLHCAAPGPAPGASAAASAPEEARAPAFWREAPMLAAAFAMLAGPAFAASVGDRGLSAPARLAGFEAASRGPGAHVIGLAGGEAMFSAPLVLSPQRVDHVAGMSGGALGSQGMRGWNGELEIRFATPQRAAAFAFATPGAWTLAEAVRDGEVVDQVRWFAGWDDPDSAYVRFEDVEFDTIRLHTDAALALLDNLQWGVSAPVEAPLGAQAAAAPGGGGGGGAAVGPVADAAAPSPAVAPAPPYSISRIIAAPPPMSLTRATAPAAAVAAPLAEIPAPPAMALMSAVFGVMGLWRSFHGRRGQARR